MEITEKDRGFDFKIKFSSAGSVHPDAIGRVGGSNPSTSTSSLRSTLGLFLFLIMLCYFYIIFSKSNI